MATEPILRDVQKPFFGFDPDTLKPKFEDIYIGGTASPSTILDQLLDMTSRKRMAAEAVAGRRREMQQQGVIPYAPAQPSAVNAAARNVVAAAGLPEPEMVAVETVQQRPTGGKIVNYPTGEKIVMSRFGTGTATKGKKGPTMIEGKPAAEWFAEAASRQGHNNKFATSIPTGKVDELGRPQYRGYAFADTDKMSPKKQRELVFEAMSKKKA